MSASVTTNPDPAGATRDQLPRGADRRRHSRSGRRTDDPHVSAWYWRRVAFLFGAYVAFVSLRNAPSTVRKWFKKRPRRA